MDAKANMMFEELGKAILFLILAIFVFIFLAKVFTVSPVIPEWSRSLNAMEKAINTLSKDNPDISRTANIQLKNNYFIRGFSSEDDMCPANKDMPHCICACSGDVCENVADNKVKFCKSLKYSPVPGFIIRNNEDKPVTYTVKLTQDSKVNASAFIEI
jgi:hypothetical protein